MYGLYAAWKMAESDRKVLVIDCDKGPFQRGSKINQARLHNGYHYPRSISTALKSSRYYERFKKDFPECINEDFQQIYAIAADYSYTNGTQFQKFCKNVAIKCEKTDKERYFNSEYIEDAYLTEEVSFDETELCLAIYEKCRNCGVEFLFSQFITSIDIENKNYIIKIGDETYRAQYVLNATYAGTNIIHALVGLELLPIKYELCEVILCNVSDNIRKVGLTIMDGPFFSLMPFGKSGYHSITAVSRTPHLTCYESMPQFKCQGGHQNCGKLHIDNCNECDYIPKSAFKEMKQLAKKYLVEEIWFEYVKSLYTVKPILIDSEIDDSRPTLLRQYSSNPDFYTVFSGKINTIYDLDVII